MNKPIEVYQEYNKFVNKQLIAFLELKEKVIHL